MFRRILVPLDGSSFADAALPLAERIASANGAELHLVRVHPLRAAPGPTADESDDRLWENERAYLDRLRESLAARGLSDVRASVLKGEVVETLLTYERFQAIDLVVMESHERHGLERVLSRSVADHVVRRGRIPVLMECNDDGARAGATTLDQILIPLDGSRMAEEAIELALSLGRPFGAQYTLLQVVTPVNVLAIRPEAPHAHRGWLAQFAAEARDYVDGVAARMQHAGLSVRSRVEAADEPAEAIACAAAQEGAVIAMATHGRGGLSRLVVGSVADAVRRTATVPLLLVRPREQRMASHDTDSYPLAR